MAPAAARSWATEAVPGLVHEDSRRVSKVVLLQRKPSHFWDLQQQQQRAVPASCVGCSALSWVTRVNKSRVQPRDRAQGLQSQSAAERKAGAGGFGAGLVRGSRQQRFVCLQEGDVGRS